MPNSYPRSEPIEIRLADRNDQVVFVLVASVLDNGVLFTSLTGPNDHTMHSISSLQARGIMPRKAVKNWQDEMIAFAASGLYKVKEIR